MININPTEQFSDLVNLIQTLRGPNGCPWDKEQTHESLKSNLIEESYETPVSYTHLTLPTNREV